LGCGSRPGLALAGAVSDRFGGLPHAHAAEKKAPPVLRCGACFFVAQLYVLAFANGKSYVGITSKTTERRYEDHFIHAFLDGSRCAVHRAMRKYGVPRVVSVMEGTLAEMKQHEVELIELLKTLVPNGYNMTRGGDGVWGLRFSKESRRRMSEAHKVENLSAETRRKIAEANRRRRMSDENRRKLYEANKGRKLSDEHCRKLVEANRRRKGFKHSEETRRRMSESQRARRKRAG
jgi:hypothetical protein